MTITIDVQLLAYPCNDSIDEVYSLLLTFNGLNCYISKVRLIVLGQFDDLIKLKLHVSWRAKC